MCPVKPEKGELLVNYREKSPSLMQTIIRVLRTVVYASKITIIFFLGNTNHSILFLFISIIVCANLTSNAVIFKRLPKRLQIYMSLLIDFCNDYRP